MSLMCEVMFLPSPHPTPTVLPSFFIPQPAVETIQPTRAVPGYPLAEAGDFAHPITPSNRRPVRRLSSLMATPSPPRQLGVSIYCVKRPPHSNDDLRLDRFSHVLVVSLTLRSRVFHSDRVALVCMLSPLFEI